MLSSYVSSPAALAHLLPDPHLARSILPGRVPRRSSAASLARNAVSMPRVAVAASHSLWLYRQLRRIGPATRCGTKHENHFCASRGAGRRTQSGGHYRALPPRSGCPWKPDGLCRWPGTQAMALATRRPLPLRMIRRQRPFRALRPSREDAGRPNHRATEGICLPTLGGEVKSTVYRIEHRFAPCPIVGLPARCEMEKRKRLSADCSSMARPSASCESGNTMFDCPEQSHTSPATISLNCCLCCPALPVSTYVFPTSKGGNSTAQWPFRPARTHCFRPPGSTAIRLLISMVVCGARSFIPVVIRYFCFVDLDKYLL